MSEREIFYSTLLLVATLISTVVALITWRRRFAPGGWALLLFISAMAWWSTTYALYWAGVYPFGHFWLDATYLGVVAVPPAFFIFVLRFTHRDNWVNRFLLALLIIQPVLTIILLWTDPWHGLFFAGRRSMADSAIFAGGPWFWANAIYLYSLNLFAVLLLIRSYVSKRAIYRKQIGLVLLAAFIPWGVNIISLLNLNPLPALDLTPLAFTLTGAIMAFSLFQYRFLDVVPVARDKLIEKMKDGVLVVDEQDRVVDVNPALTELLNVDILSLIGQGVSELLPNWEKLQADFEEKDSIGQEIIMSGYSSQYLNIRLIRLRDNPRKGQGKLIIFRDITTQKQLETEREELIGTLQEALIQVKTLSGLVPICANCKQIRDDEGYWHQIEVYIETHSEAEFTHGICPECKVKLYPEISGKKGQSDKLSQQ